MYHELLILTFEVMHEFRGQIIPEPQQVLILFVKVSHSNHFPKAPGFPTPPLVEVEILAYEFGKGRTKPSGIQHNVRRRLNDNPHSDGN